MRGLAALGYAQPARLGRRVSAWDLGWLLPAGLFLATLALYVSTRSISLDDFDSFNFARAIDHFDPRLNQPQPPGYPVYVFLARLFDLVVHDHQAALLLLSGASGAVAVLALYCLGADLGAPWAALPLALAPLFWLSATMALSDMPGLALASVAALLLHRSLSDPRRLVAGAALTGLTLGLRPQDALIPAGVFVLSLALGREEPRTDTLNCPRRWSLAALHRWHGPREHDGPQDAHGEQGPRVGLRAWVLAALAFVLACVAWVLPLAVSAGGPAAAVSLMAGQSSYVGATDSLLARPLTWPNVAARLSEFGSVFSAYFGGPSDGGLVAFLVLAVALAVLAWLSPRARGLALAWLLPYAAFMILFLRPDDPRKVLPAIPPMLLLLGGLRPKLLGAAACAVAAGWFAFSAVPLIQTLDSVKAPPEQAAAYIAATLSPQETLVLAGSSYNAVRYRDPGFKSYLLDELDQTAVARDLSSGAYRNLVVLDKEGFTVPENYVGVASRTFQRDPLVLPKASTVWLAVYRPLDELRDTDLALPAGSVHLGSPEDVRYVTDGWYRPETIAGTSARWTDRQAKLRFWVDAPRDATLQLDGIAFPPGQQLTVQVNGQQVATMGMATDWAPYTISVPAAVLHSSAINAVTLEHSQAISAYDATNGQSLDRRPLAAAYSSFELTWR